MPLVKIGELYADLSQCSFTLSDFASEGPKIKVHFLDEWYSFSLKHQPKEYKALETYLATVETLEIYNIRAIREEVFDPFNEMPPTLYALFCDLPNADKLHMVLTHTGEGRIESMGQEVLHWYDLDEALKKLQEYKRDYVAPDTDDGLPMFL